VNVVAHWHEVNILVAHGGKMLPIPAEYMVVYAAFASSPPDSIGESIVFQAVHPHC